MRKLGISLFAVATLVPAVAAADDFSYSWTEKRLASDVGIATTLGGGIAGFTNETMRSTTTNNVGGLWDLRVTLGSHLPLALDVSYTGTAGEVNSLIGTTKGDLIGTTVAGALRYNILPHYFLNPYAFAGIGWQRFDVTNANFSLAAAGMADSDNSIVFPMGVGVALRDKSGLVFDLRGAFRANVKQGLVLDKNGVDYAPMHAWEAGAALGYEF